MLTKKIVGVLEVSVIYIYIYIYKARIQSTAIQPIHKWNYEYRACVLQVAIKKPTKTLNEILKKMSVVNESLTNENDSC